MHLSTKKFKIITIPVFNNELSNISSGKLRYNVSFGKILSAKTMNTMSNRAEFLYERYKYPGDSYLAPRSLHSLGRGSISRSLSPRFVWKWELFTYLKILSNLPATCTFRNAPLETCEFWLYLDISNLLATCICNLKTRYFKNYAQ